MGIQFNGNNNPFWFINGKRDMKPNQPDKVIENKVQEGNMQPANTLQEETSDAPMLSFFDLDFQSMYEGNNVTVNVTPEKAAKKTYTPQIIQPSGYENDFKFETKEEAVYKMKLRQTSCPGVYCELHNPNLPAGNYTHQRHYVWNDTSKQMIELKDVYHLDASGSQAKGLDGYEEVQAYINGYNFTDEVGVYEKDGQKFNFNAEKSEFSKSTDISNYSNNDVESMKNEIEEFLLEVDGIDVSGDNYARHLNKEQYNKFSSFAALLSDKNRFPDLTLEFEYKEDGLCDVYLRLNNESVYSVDDLDASQVKQLLAEAKEKSENMEPSLDVNNLSAESVKSYLKTKFPELIDSGAISDKLCEYMGIITTLFMEENEGVVDLDPEIIAKKCLEAQTELLVEAAILGYDGKWYLDANLATTMDIKCSMVESSEESSEQQTVSKAPAFDLSDGTRRAAGVPGNGNDNGDGEDDDILKGLFDPDVFKIDLDDSLLQIKESDNIPENLKKAISNKFGNVTYQVNSLGAVTIIIKDANGKSIGSINCENDTVSMKTDDFFNTQYTYDSKTGNLKEVNKTFDMIGFFEVCADQSSRIQYNLTNSDGFMKYLQGLPENTQFEIISTMFNKSISDFDPQYALLSSIVPDLKRNSDFALNFFFGSEDNFQKLDSYVDNILKKKGYNDLLRLKQNSGFSKMEKLSETVLVMHKRQDEVVKDAGFNWKTDTDKMIIQQGKTTGDCWLVATVLSGMENKNFRDLLNSMVQKDDKNRTYTVTLHGKDYKFSFDEVSNAKELSSNPKTRAFEMAMRESLGEMGLKLEGGNLFGFMRGMLGVEINKLPEDLKDFAYKIYRNNYTIPKNSSFNRDSWKQHLLNVIQTDTNFPDDLRSNISTLGVAGNISKNFKIHGIDENGNKVEIHHVHAYAITKIDDNYVYVKDPNNSAKTIKISKNDVMKYCDVETINVSGLKSLGKKVEEYLKNNNANNNNNKDNTQIPSNYQNTVAQNENTNDDNNIDNNVNDNSGIDNSNNDNNIDNSGNEDNKDYGNNNNDNNVNDNYNNGVDNSYNENNNVDNSGNEDNKNYGNNDNGNNDVDKDNNNVDNTGNEDGNGGVNNNNDIDNNDGLDDLDFSGLDSGNNDGNNNTTILESGTDDLSSLFKTTTTTHSGGETTGSITGTVTDDERNTIIQNAIADKYQELVQKYGKDANIHVTVDSNGQMSWDVYQGSGYDYASQIINNIKNELLNNPNYLFASTDGTASGDGGLGALLDIETKLQNGEYNTESGEIDYGKLYTDLAMNGLGGISGINTQTSPDSNETRVIITKANGEVEIYATPSTPESPDTPNQNEISALTTNTTETTETDDYGMVWNVETETTTDVNGTVVNETVTKTSENGTKETVTTTRNNDGSYTKHTEITSGGKVVRNYDEDYTVIDGRVTASTTTYYDIDENGNKVYSGKEVTTRNYNDDGSYVNYTIEYDKDNNITHESSVLYANDEEYTQWEKEYNDDGTITTTSYVYQKDEDGDLYENATMTSITDNDGNVTTTTIEGNTHIISVVDKNGNLISEVVQTYNDDGELVDEEKTFGTNDINTPGTYVDDEAGKGYKISADAQSELMEAILRFNAFPDDQLKALADAIKNGFVPDDLLYLLDEDLKDIFTSLTNGEVPLSSADPDKNFNGFVLPNGGGNMLESYAEKLVSMGMYSDIKAARDGICGYLGLDSGMAVFTEIADELANIIDKMLKDDSLGMGLLKEQLESAYSVAMYAKEAGDNDRYNMYIAEAANYVQKIERHNLVQEISEQLYGSIAKAITIDDGSGTLGVMVDYNSIYNYVYDMIDRDYAAGYNSYQIHLRAADRFANIDELKSMLDEGADSDDVLRMLGYIENDDIKSYSWLNDQDLFAGVNTSYQSHTPQHRRYKQYQKVSYIESLQWKIKCMREDMGNDSARNTPSFVNDWLFGECNSHFYDEEIERLERELENIQHTINNYKDNYYNAIIQFGINSDQAQNALDAYQNVLEEYNSPDSYRAESTLTFYYA